MKHEYLLFFLLMGTISISAQVPPQAGRTASTNLNDNTGRHISDEKDHSALIRAIQTNDFKEAERLLDAKFDPNARDEETLTPLHRAAAGGDTNMIKLLLSVGADVNARTEDSLTPLYYASTVAAVAELLKAGADPNANDSQHRTPLFYVADKTAEDTVPRLIEAGADVNYRDPAGIAPLHFAVIRHKINLMKALLDHGAQPAMVNIEGKTPYDYAAALNDVGAQELLSKYLGKTPFSLTPFSPEKKKSTPIVRRRVPKKSSEGWLSSIIQGLRSRAKRVFE